MCTDRTLEDRSRICTAAHTTRAGELTDLQSSRGTPHDLAGMSQHSGGVRAWYAPCPIHPGGTRMRFARILVPMAAAFWMTATLFADQHGHAPVPHPTQAHATPAT